MQALPSPLRAPAPGDATRLAATPLQRRCWSRLAPSPFPLPHAAVAELSTGGILAPTPRAAPRSAVAERALLGGSAATAAACVGLRRQLGRRRHVPARARPQAGEEGLDEELAQEDTRFEALMTKAQQTLGTELQAPEPAGGKATKASDSQVRSRVAMLKNYAQEVERKLELAELRADKAEKELVKVTRFSKYIMRQAEEFQEERDEARERCKELEIKHDRLREELAKNRREAEQRLGDISTAVEEALRRGRSRYSPPPAEVTSLAEMGEEELKAECQQLGLSEEGSVALLRVRLRAARVRQRGESAGGA